MKVDVKTFGKFEQVQTHKQRTIKKLHVVSFVRLFLVFILKPEIHIVRYVLNENQSEHKANMWYYLYAFESTSILIETEIVHTISTLRTV